MKSLISIILLFLAGCFQGKPIPENKKDYIGHWTTEGIDLTITPAGTVFYKKNLPGFKVSLTGLYIQEFTDLGFTVGLSFWSTEFIIQQAPHLEADQWKMVVDGHTLTRIDQDSALEFESQPLENP